MTTMILHGDGRVEFPEHDARMKRWKEHMDLVYPWLLSKATKAVMSDWYSPEGLRPDRYETQRIARRYSELNEDYVRRLMFLHVGAYSPEMFDETLTSFERAMGWVS